MFKYASLNLARITELYITFLEPRVLHMLGSTQSLSYPLQGRRDGSEVKITRVQFSTTTW